MKVQEVKHPQSRYDLISYIKDLSDFEMQKNEWCIPKNNPKAPHVFWDNLRFPIECLLDEYCLHEQGIPEGAIGWKLRNDDEAKYVGKAARTLKNAIDTLGAEQQNSVYLSSPLWQEVVKSSKEAYDVLMIDENIDDLIRQ